MLITDNAKSPSFITSLLLKGFLKMQLKLNEFANANTLFVSIKSLKQSGLVLMLARLEEKDL
jgi:hypothetical protein